MISVKVCGCVSMRACVCSVCECVWVLCESQCSVCVCVCCASLYLCVHIMELRESGRQGESDRDV
jgi:hypothetical protein